MNEPSLLRVHRGAADHRLRADMFFSEDPAFAADYGEVREYEIDVSRAADTLDPAVIRGLLPLFDPYDGADIETVEDYMARSSDTWEMVEEAVMSHGGGPAVWIVYEGGTRSFLVRDPARVRLLEPRDEPSSGPRP